MISYLKRVYDEIKNVIKNINHIHTPIIAQMQLHRLYESPRIDEDGCLLRFGFKACSQNDEDGIIQEIFSRIGTTNRYFVEFGVGNGLENNTLYLLIKGWKGVWIEGGKNNAEIIRRKFHSLINKNILTFDNSFISKENINSLLAQKKVPNEVDLLSIDIDGNDYHVFKEINCITPRVVVVEYNAKFPPPVLWVMKYNPKHTWDSTDYMGASLKSFEYLFNDKGYSLVGCNITGSNAFFVRKDLVGDRFQQPFSAENHYEPARHLLTAAFRGRLTQNFGEFEII